MWIYAWNKQLKEVYVGSTPVKEIYLWNTKVRPEDHKYNLDLNNGQPIWRLHDWELWFRVNVKDASEPFKIAMNGSNSAFYDWDISVDWAEPVRYYGGISDSQISLVIPKGKHYVKITPHGRLIPGWAAFMGNGEYNNLWNNDKNKLEFWLEWLPWYAFMARETKVGHSFLSKCRYGCTSLTSMPSWFNLPQGITSVESHFLEKCRSGCTSLTSMPSWFNIPQSIKNAEYFFLRMTWFNCTSLTSNSPAEPFNLPNLDNTSTRFADNCFWWSCPITPDTPTPWSSVMVHRN